MLTYGQIRPTNFAALREHFGHEPPWPMERAPHVELVEAIVHGRDPGATSYARYLRATHADPERSIERSVETVRRLLTASAWEPIDVEHQAVLDGNHRWAVAHVLGRPIERRLNDPYQTLAWPDGSEVAGRRLNDRFPIDYPWEGKIVLDLGASAGMQSIFALRNGAARAVLIEQEARSTTWQMLTAWDMTSRATVIVARAEAAEVAAAAADVVLAFSVVAHVEPQVFQRIVAGRDCVLETHHQDAQPPETGHAWIWLKTVSYSRSDPDRRRDLWLGRWLGRWRTGP